MPSNTANATALTEWEDFLDQFDNDDDDFGGGEKNKNKQAEKDKQPDKSKKADKNKETQGQDDLGLDKEIETKKVRVPRVKLDEKRLLSDAGIPKLRKKAKSLKLKGKGHEFSDAARLLSFYQLWLDDLFPKAKFLDALAMVEKAGHKTIMHKARMEWINEYKPISSTAVDDGDEDPATRPSATPKEPTRIAPMFEEMAERTRNKTPEPIDDLFGDDIYDATPRASVPARPAADHGPDDDEMDALMAMEDLDSAPRSRPNGPAKGASGGAIGSIFGGGTSSKPAGPPDDLDDDDLDALMAEAEAQTTSRSSAPAINGGSIFGDGSSAKPKVPVLVPTANKGRIRDDGDDLDALMAEAEAKAPSKNLGNGVSTQKAVSFDEEEEAMAEMDGLW